MNQEPPSPATKALRQLQIFNLVLWVVAGLIAFVAPTLTSSPEKGRFIYMMCFLLLYAASRGIISTTWQRREP